MVLTNDPRDIRCIVCGKRGFDSIAEARHHIEMEHTTKEITKAELEWK